MQPPPSLPTCRLHFNSGVLTWSPVLARIDVMEEKEVMRLIAQYLHEQDLRESLTALQRESGVVFEPACMIKKTGELQAILDDHFLRATQKETNAVSLEHLFQKGSGEYANKLWCSFQDFSGGMNVLSVKLIQNGVLAFGSSQAVVGVVEFPQPFPTDTPPIPPIPTLHKFCAGAILAVDFHPKKRNLLLCGSMDRTSLILDLDKSEEPLVQKFTDHSKYVVRAQWAPSGKYFTTASYDHTACVYREMDSGLYELVEKLNFKGAVEGMAFARDCDVFIIGSRNDYLLNCFDLASGSPVKCREINVNTFGDDYVSFVPMHISFSPKGDFFLVSTDRDRVILFSWESGKEIANFYGAMNDEFSQPRHCWDPSGKYIYGTSQDKTICVWEIRTQTVVTRLAGHTEAVRDLHFCNELGLLVSCGFDGAVKLWKSSSTEEKDDAADVKQVPDC